MFKTEPENNFFRTNQHLCSFSKDGSYLASAFQVNLMIKNTGTFDVFQSFVFADVIEYIEWSPDNEYVLCANFKKAVIQIFSILYPEWKCKLIEGSIGLERVLWAPDSKHFLSLSDFNIQLSIWSLEDKEVRHIQNLKSSVKKQTNLQFSPDGNHLATVITNDGLDYVGIYKTSNWKISRKLMCERLSSIDGINWSPNGELLCIWSSIISESKLLIFSILSESHVGAYCPEKRKESRNVRYGYTKHLKGIDIVKWMPSGQFLAVAGFNELVVLINHITWQPILQFNCNPVINNNYHKVFNECVIHVKDPSKTSSLSIKHVQEVLDRPVNVPILKKDGKHEPQFTNLDILEFSASGRYLALRHQVYPSALWIWDIISDCTDHLLLRNSISNIRWSGEEDRLMIFTETVHFFEWHPTNVACISTPRGIIVSDARWHARGKIVALCGYNKVAIYHV
ncbi:WD repeat-containing protein WRAP73 isoform X2 [Orussus abietinus]|uniref:WD repeat-containing protein WRAP73 isoform X2 n=1 Tax=Orussus abietinus TaxID=222816 RepID=UPI000C715BE8|nr:WD repeat-containing protein WRAP73 isoform X2 [Orussus abietinus]